MRVNPVSRFVAVTLTPATTAPELSVTTPRIVPVMDCDRPVEAMMARRAQTERKKRTCMVTSSRLNRTNNDRAFPNTRSLHSNLDLRPGNPGSAELEVGGARLDPAWNAEVHLISVNRAGVPAGIEDCRACATHCYIQG
jgi:hypothetical protein